MTDISTRADEVQQAFAVVATPVDEDKPRYVPVLWRRQLGHAEKAAEMIEVSHPSHRVRIYAMHPLAGWLEDDIDEYVRELDERGWWDNQEPVWDTHPQWTEQPSGTG